MIFRTPYPVGVALLFLCCLCCNVVTAQEPDSTILCHTTHSTLYGIGASYQQDTYLSPLQYKGMQVNILHETQRRISWFKGRLSRQSLFQVNFTGTSSPADNADYLGGQVHYDHAWLYNWPLSQRWHLMAGPEVGGMLGVLYNTRNGNNPAQALANIHLGVSAGAIFRFHLWRRDFGLRYHADLSLFSAMFSPQYGQSYYELFSLGNYDHNICLTHPFNARRWRNQLTLDIPGKRRTFRIGGFLDIQESHVHDIRHSDYTIGFVFGWVRHLSIHKSKRTVPEGFIM